MKLLVVCMAVCVGLAVSDTKGHSRGCIYILGRCSRECEVGTHAYTTGCGYMTPEPTCEVPEPVQDTRGMICDYSACYCDSPTVRDTVNNKCVKLEDCPKVDPNAKPKESNPDDDGPRV